MFNMLQNPIGWHRRSPSIRKTDQSILQKVSPVFVLVSNELNRSGFSRSLILFTGVYFAQETIILMCYDSDGKYYLCVSAVFIGIKQQASDSSNIKGL